jgi:toxin YoeB
MIYRLRFTRTAIRDLERHKKSGDKKLLRKIEILLSELREHPLTGTGRPEQLKHELKGCYSRRINKEHRLVYSIEEEIITVYVLSAHSHYGDEK